MGPKSVNPIAELKAEFERCWPWLDDALGSGAFVYNGKLWKSHSKQDVWERIAKGWVFLWPGKKCAIATFFEHTPTGIKSHHTWLAGGDLGEIVKMTPIVEKWGKEHACHRQSGDGRRGWLRKLDGYREIGTRREKAL